MNWAEAVLCVWIFATAGRLGAVGLEQVETSLHRVVEQEASVIAASEGAERLLGGMPVPADIQELHEHCTVEVAPDALFEWSRVDAQCGFTSTTIWVLGKVPGH